jgi:hypothetical protein
MITTARLENRGGSVFNARAFSRSDGGEAFPGVESGLLAME